MPAHIFTVEDANRLLPKLSRLLERLVGMKAELIAKQSELAGLLRATNGADAHRLERLVRGKEELKFMAEEFNLSLHELSRTGALLKDVDDGLVDFPAIRDGREVFLCWRFGETEVAHWHGIDEGFAGRKPLAASAWDAESRAEAGSDGPDDADDDVPTVH